MHSYVKILLFSLFAVAFQHFARLFYISEGYGNTILKQYPGECRIVSGFSTNGAEDMTLLPSGHLIITSGLVGFAHDFDYEKTVAKGAMYVMDTNQNFDTVEKMSLEGWPENEHFEPHGVHHWVHTNGSVSVFVVLHMPERVARFLYDGKKTLKLTKSYQNAEFMRNINSVFVTSEDSFYLTNMLQARFRDRLMAWLEFFLYMPLSNIIFVNGESYISAVDGLQFPNGLTGDGRHVYVATKDMIRIFSKNRDNTLQSFKTIPIVIGSLDNLKLDSQGDLWIGCQNVLRVMIDYMAKPSEHKCQSKVIRIRDPTGVAEVESVFTDDTSLIQAATVGLYTKGKLLIGSMVDRMVTCDVKYLSGAH